MTDKELRRLKRVELLEILYYLQKENEDLKAEIRGLKEHPFESMGLPEGFMQQLQQMVQEKESSQEAEEAPAEQGEEQS